jgi:hypothetical protein
MDAISHTRFMYKDKIAFALIPKNASMSMSRALTLDSKWDTISNETGVLKGDWTYYTLIRNPIDRWVSAICQIYFGYESLDSAEDKYLSKVNKLMDTTTYLEKFIKNGDDDPHTKKQSWYLRNLPNKKLFKLENLNCLQKELNLLCKIKKINAAIGHRALVKKRMFEILDIKPKYLDRLKELYSKDIILYNEAK